MTNLIATINDTDASSGSSLVLIALVFATYFLPSIVACMRQKAEGGGGTFFVNLLLGWTVLGWFVAFIWACTGRTKADIVREQTQHRELLAALQKPTRS
ncbi:MAG TPA: superinfection immunity protein [Candidatus Udaeobacter sp.]|nr:superinfection immunity protein [Candidatus Udaeobacter sp.]